MHAMCIAYEPKKKNPIRLPRFMKYIQADSLLLALFYYYHAGPVSGQMR